MNQEDREKKEDKDEKQEENESDKHPGEYYCGICGRMMPISHFPH